MIKGRWMMQVNFYPVFILTRREVRDQMRDWRIVVPIVSLTIFFPWLLNFTAQQLTGFLSKYGSTVISSRMIPFLLLMVGFFPITISLVIALESFVGEKERHSIEPLLSSPLEDWQLYLGKLLASLVAPLLASYLGTIVYLIGIGKGLGWQAPASLIVQVFLLAFVQALVMVSGAVVVSTQTTSVRAANLLASFIVVPMALLVEGESIVMFWARYDVLWCSILAQVLIASLLVRMGLAYFNREELLGRELDILNFRWVWKVFKNAFTGQARSPVQWYRLEMPKTLRRLALPVLVVLLILVASGILGAILGRQYALPEAVLSPGNMRDKLMEGVKDIPLFTAGTIPVIWLHNLRALFLATLMGIFSFGILGILVIMLPLGITGFLAISAAGSGFSPWLFLAAFILPHGTLEIPALVLMGAAILRLGATLMTPARGKTIGEAWLQALADWARVFVGLAVPLLLAAAVIEVWITPRLAQLLIGG
ncbi:MAG: stage II sporulation protein M [Omnitrophica WOR_2 bacterium]